MLQFSQLGNTKPRRSYIIGGVLPTPIFLLSSDTPCGGKMADLRFYHKLMITARHPALESVQELRLHCLYSQTSILAMQ